MQGGKRKAKREKNLLMDFSLFICNSPLLYYWLSLILLADLHAADLA